MDKNEIMRLAAAEAEKTMRENIGGPFGAAIVKDGKLIAVASNTVLRDSDPSAHAEVNAIRKAGRILQTHDLSGCEIYATGYPCPMCLSAIIWANIKKVYYGCEAWEAEKAGFRDDMIYDYLEKNRKDENLLKLDQVGHDDCERLYEEYTKEKKTVY
ncbi:MAG: nucleoside deaminase [Sphaerochaetaceae bacterium]|nr:nucleoside deaminase [Sphaerochaetaceae bacterium]MDC7247549.1 nucleoside deaminase [Sphaerochaetaceae bacterium]